MARPVPLAEEPNLPKPVDPNSAALLSPEPADKAPALGVFVPVPSQPTTP
ncbi:hypothetical protein [Methyloraptor flagellatus]|uniref:Uncharacterized protein n=1 Tax=Methyloraptor flagellatus TaxID=3162530 RepID=A0AAU7XBK6_9HYPH